MKGAAVRIAAQAKLNLHLRVLAREDSGFHSLETVFHRIELADDLLINVTDGERTLDVEGADTGPMESNLAWRAATAYSARNGWPKGFTIEIVKRIPVGAGLGGGSADAAAVLRALEALSPNRMGSHGLLQLAAALGSDVSFLASDAVMALAWGHGERMIHYTPLPQIDVVLLTPEFSVATADAYRWLDEDRATGGFAPGVPLVIEPLFLTGWPSIARFAHNDLEAPVVARHPEIGGHLERLRQLGPVMAQMTGSGSTIFAIFDSPPGRALVPEEHRYRVISTMTSIDVVQPVRVG